MRTCLRRQQVYSRARLAAVWAAQPAFLQQQLGMWLQRPARQLLDGVWPQLLREAAAGAGGSGSSGGAGASGAQRKHSKRKKGGGSA